MYMKRWHLLVDFEGRHRSVRILAQSARDAAEQYLAAGGLSESIFGGSGVQARKVLLWAPLDFEASVFLCLAGQADSYASITVAPDHSRRKVAAQLPKSA